MKGRKTLTIAALFVTGLYLFRQELISTAFEKSLAHFTHESIAYSDRLWENGKLVYTDLQIGENFLTKKAEITLIPRLPFKLEAEIYLFQPSIAVDVTQEEESLPLPIFLSHPLLTPKWDIEEGTILISKEEQDYQFSFTFVSGTTPQDLGTAVIYDAETTSEAPLFYGEFTQDKKTITALFDVGPIDLNRLSPLMPLWTTERGEVEIHGTSTWTKQGEVQELKGEVILQSGKLAHESGIGIEAKKLISTFDYTPGIKPLWKALELNADLEEGTFTFQDAALQNCTATVRMSKDEAPTVELNADLKHGEERCPIQAQISGQLEENQFWAEAKIQLQTEIPFDLTASLSSTDLESFAVEGVLEKEQELLEFGFNFQEGWYRSEALSHPFYAPILAHFYPEFAMEGTVHLSGNFTPDKIISKVHAAELTVGGVHFHDLITQLTFQDSKLTLAGFQAALPDCEGVMIASRSAVVDVQNTFSGAFEIKAVSRAKTPLFEGAVIFSDPAHFTFSGEAGGNSVENLQITHDIEAETLAFAGKVSEISLSGLFSYGALPYQFSNLSAAYKDAIVKAAGTYQGGQLHLSIHSLQGVVPKPYDLRVDAPLVLNFSPLTLTGASLSLLESGRALAHLKSDTFAYNTEAKKWESDKVDVEAGDLAAILNVRLGADSMTFQGLFEKGKMFAVEPKRIYGIFEPPYLNFKCYSELFKVPLVITAKVNAQEGLSGGMLVQENAALDDLSISWDASHQLKEIKGSCSGFAFDLGRTPEGLTGSVKLAVATRASRLLPQELADIQGIEFSGTWQFPLALEGELSGIECMIKKYQLADLKTNVTLTPEKCILRNLAITDPAGELFIKEAVCLKTDAWQITAPLIRGKNIIPSLLRIAGVEAHPKPFTIRQAVFTNFTAALSDLKSLTAEGKFHFTNTVKKESSLFDLPQYFLKDLGLDLTILSPISGELSCHLEGGKLWLTGIENTFSEGRRSEFYFAEGAHQYLDFEGNLHVDLRIKQDSVLKLAEPFTLKVRGTVEKPRYSVR